MSANAKQVFLDFEIAAFEPSFSLDANAECKNGR